jgi:hypothetical protein
VPVTMRARVAGRASHSPIKAAVYLCRAIVALVLALVRDWPAQLEEGSTAEDVEGGLPAGVHPGAAAPQQGQPEQQEVGP